MNDAGYNDVWAALVASVALLRKVRELALPAAPGPVDAALLHEVDAVLDAGKRALDDHAEQVMKDEQQRQAIRDAARRLRNAP